MDAIAIKIVVGEMPEVKPELEADMFGICGCEGLSPSTRFCHLQSLLRRSRDRVVDEILTVKMLFVPGESGPSLDDAFRESDLIISKGTGNFEALKGDEKGKATIYMLKVKCRPVADETGVDIGKFVVMIEN